MTDSGKSEGDVYRFICADCGNELEDPPTLPVECECGGNFERADGVDGL